VSPGYSPPEINQTHGSHNGHCGQFVDLTSILVGEDFCTVSSWTETARTRRRCIRLCARSRSAPRARRAAGARHGPDRAVAVRNNVVTHCDERVTRDAVDPPTRQRHGPSVEVGSPPGRGGAHCAEPPPSVKPAARPDPSGPPAHRPLSSDRHCGKSVTSGGAGWIGSKRLDPRAPATPRPVVAGRPGPAEDGTCLPLLPSIHRDTVQDPLTDPSDFPGAGRDSDAASRGLAPANAVGLTSGLGAGAVTVVAGRGPDHRGEPHGLR
jgi:hypothetical protein